MAAGGTGVEKLSGKHGWYAFPTLFKDVGDRNFHLLSIPENNVITFYVIQARNWFSSVTEY